jgi:uncharacterized membrane protein YozB (DUF420 family)
MNTMSAIFVVITALFLGAGWVAINKKDKPIRRRSQEK